MESKSRTNKKFMELFAKFGAILGAIFSFIYNFSDSDRIGHIFLRPINSIIIVISIIIGGTIGAIIGRIIEIKRNNRLGNGSG